MQEDNSMVEKILNDIEHIVINDANLKEFCIIPTPEENPNKSPVHYEEHHLGLESWCIKYVYKYAYNELFKVRKLLRKNRLQFYKMEKLNKLLIGALLIHSDVSTFWSMKRELVICEVINLDDELSFSKLVLTSKSKSNEAFAYRKWILIKMLKNLNDQTRQELLLENEFEVTELAAEKAQNNYHAWTHRIWCLQTICLKNTYQTVMRQLAFSLKWIGLHVSEHAGYHYRQHLFQYLKQFPETINLIELYSHLQFVETELGLQDSPKDNGTEFLDYLIGRSDSNKFENSLKCNNYRNYMCVILYDLLYTVRHLNRLFPDHESLWCYRRFLVFHLLKAAYEYHGINSKSHIKMNESLFEISVNTNIVNTNLFNHDGCSSTNMLFEDNGEKYRKLPKYDLDKVESSYLYKFLVKTEINFIKENSSSSHSATQRDLAHRYEKWLKFILQIKVN